MTKTKTLILLAAIFTGLCILLVRQHEGAWKTHQLIGLAIMAPSLLLWGLARWQLGGSFSIRPQAKALVTHGLYSKIRNPVYLFGGLMIAGLFVYSGNPWFFLLFLILIPLQVIRLRKESQVLEATFGDSYRSYKRHTWF
jgi:protein-S-isoprenylcysteine O-methyltransferase Ste14